MKWVLLATCFGSVGGLYLHTNQLWQCYERNAIRDSWKVMRRIALLLMVLELSIGLEIGLVSHDWSNAVVTIIAAPVVALMVLTSAGTALLAARQGDADRVKASRKPSVVWVRQARSARPADTSIGATLSWLDHDDK